MSCAFEGCENAVNAKGLCCTHYRQQREGRVLVPIRRANVACDGTKTCNTCKVPKPVKEFSRQTGSGDGLQRSCVMCNAAYRLANKERIAAERVRYRAENLDAILVGKREQYTKSGSRSNRAAAVRRYGITESALLELRGRPCDVCGRMANEVGGRGAHHIDHCHETGAVRGALCHGCNTSLGHFKDSPELLARAIHYLTRGADYRDVDREN
jgi:hypothetical protein